MAYNIGLARTLLIFALFIWPYGSNAQPSSSEFVLHDGDRVTFYGDSITEQREYTEDVEAYVLTRYPTWKISFHNAGVSGDKVSGGWAGPIDLRLDRDVFAWRPDVITIMLGMNDFYYRLDQSGIFSTYTEGYRHILESIQKNNPHARLTLIQSSPYDDVTRDATIPGGLNSVLSKYSAFAAKLGHEHGAQVADFNLPMNAVLKAVNSESPALAQQIIPDRVHPQQGGHWILAESLLKCWHAPALVTSVVIDAGVKPRADAENTSVSELTAVKTKGKSGINWTQSDRALPLPFPSSEVDPVLGLVLKSSDIIAVLDQETLKVHALEAGTYDLLIDGRIIGNFSAAQLAAGINLATMDTPMLQQARLVAFDTEKVNNLESARFGLIAGSVALEHTPTADALAAAYLRGVDHQHADALPLLHHYELVPANQ